MIGNNYGGDPIDLDSAIASTSKCATELASSIRPVENIVTDAVEFDSNVMIVGAYGVLLDLDHGTYPHMTSSNPSVGRTCTGLGTGPGSNGGVVGVFKDYRTRDGVDPFPTENDGSGDNIREIADKFCVTTDRAQRTLRNRLNSWRRASPVPGSAGAVWVVRSWSLRHLPACWSDALT